MHHTAPAPATETVPLPATSPLSATPPTPAPETRPAHGHVHFILRQKLPQLVPRWTRKS